MGRGFFQLGNPLTLPRGVIHMTEPVLEVRNLRTSFDTDRGLFRAVDDVSFSVGKGQTVGLVGESGCGKSVTALSIMGLIPMPPGRLAGGEVLFEGRDVLRMKPNERRPCAGARWR